MALNYEHWGVDIRTLPAGLLTRLNVALNVYRAFRGYRQAAGRTVQWVQSNPDAWRIVEHLLPDVIHGDKQTANPD